MRSHALPHKGGKGYVIEWAIDFELMQIEKGKPYSPAMEDTVMGAGGLSGAVGRSGVDACECGSFVINARNLATSVANARNVTVGVNTRNLDALAGHTTDPS